MFYQKQSLEPSISPVVVAKTLNGKGEMGTVNQLVKILAVDDEPDIRELLEEYLGGQGYEVATAENGAEMRHILERQTFDLVLLDINMPGEDGLSLARFLREHHRVCIIMLTAASDVVDRIIGLEMGADDYVTKPFDPRELLARIKSVLRRGVAPVADTATDEPLPAGETPAAPTDNRVRFGRCVLDLEAHKLRVHENDEEIPITSMEFDLLKAFATRPNRVLSRDQLLDLAHNRDWEPFDRSIDIRIARLRRKIEFDPAKPQTIKTVRGAGYIFVPHSSES
jgi:two-component system phosphate regulon response regulator OmpR